MVENEGFRANGHQIQILIIEMYRFTNIEPKRMQPAYVFISFSIFWYVFLDYFGTILGPFWEHFGTIWGSFWEHVGIILGPFWDHFGIILGSFWALGWSLGGSWGPRRAPRAPKSVKMLILEWFNNFKELPKRSRSALRASKIAPGGSESGPGAKKDAKIVNLGVNFGLHCGVILGFGKCHRRKGSKKWKSSSRVSATHILGVPRGPKADQKSIKNQPKKVSKS